MWVLLRTVQDAQDLDGLPFHTEHCDEGRAAYDQLARAFDTANTTRRRPGQRICQAIHLGLDLLVHVGGSQRIVFGDVVQLLKTVGIGPSEPFNGRQEVACACLRQAARRLALSF